MIRRLLAVLPVLGLSACEWSIAAVAPLVEPLELAEVAEAPPEVPQQKKERRSGWICRPNGLDLGPEIEDGLLLVGEQGLTHGARRAISISRSGARVFLHACWHGLLARDLYRIQRKLRRSELDALLAIAGESRTFEAGDWRYRLVVRRGGRELAPELRAAVRDETLPEIVKQLLDQRRRWSRDAKLLLRHGDHAASEGPPPRVLLPELAAHELAELAPGGRVRDFDWEGVLELRRYHNRETIEALIKLSRDPRPAISRAAHGALNDVRDAPARTPLARHWSWWNQVRGAWPQTAPRLLPASAGEVQLLAGGVSGADAVHLDPEGELWMRAGVDGRVYRHDAAADRFVLAAVDGSSTNDLAAALLESRLSPLGEPSWLSRDQQYALRLPPPGLPASTGSRIELARLESGDATIVLRSPLPAGTRSDQGLAAASGRTVLLSRAKKSWSEPHALVVHELSTASETIAPVPSAVTLHGVAPIAGDSPGFLAFRDERRPLDQRAGAVELWWVSERGDRAERLFAGQAEAGEVFRVWPHVTPGGASVLVTLETRDAEARAWLELGWLSLHSGAFQPVLRSPKPSAGDRRIGPWDAAALSASTDGQRVVFVWEGQVYSWRAP